MQQAMYKAAIDSWESRGSESGSAEVAHLGVITALKKICNHPSLVINRQSEQLPGEVLSYIKCRLVESFTHKCSYTLSRSSQGAT
jgi:SNF2 family DNA or RNA helicase